MSPGLKTSINKILKKGVRHRGRLRTTQALRQLAETEFTNNEGDEEPAPEPEPAEPFELEDAGDSDASLYGQEALSPFDSEWVSTLPLIFQLPARARPLAHFFIDEQFEAHKIGRGQDDLSHSRLLVARAIAKHIRDHGTYLQEVGDWCHIPAIMDDEGLINLAPAGTDRDSLKHRLGHMGSDLKAFAIILPSGDVVTPQALISPAQDVRKATRLKGGRPTGLTGKRATRAGALRAAAQSPAQLAGDTWSEEDWDKFEDTQRKKKKTKKDSAPRPPRGPRKKER
jgi:hypothetical protein